MTRVLPRQQQALAASGVNFHRATNARAAMDLAYELEEYLPLDVSQFVTFDPRHRFKAPHALVITAEKVLRVTDHNRPPHPRIDMFCYMQTGEVIRLHPDSMQPHTMPWRCNLFDVPTACSEGVGAALHRRPPRRVATSCAAQLGEPSDVMQPGNLLCSREDMTAFCRYDIQQVNWSHVREKLMELGDEDQEIEWSDGEHYPWWLWLANTGKMRDVANDGISRVRVVVANDVISRRVIKSVVVDSVRGTYNIIMDPTRDKPKVTPQPRLYHR